MATNLLEQIEELSDLLAQTQKKHHLTEATVVKIAEMVFSNHWSAKQFEMQLVAAGLSEQPNPDYPEPMPLHDEQLNEHINGREEPEETGA